MRFVPNTLRVVTFVVVALFSVATGTANNLTAVENPPPPPAPPPPPGMPIDDNLVILAVIAVIIASIKLYQHKTKKAQI